MITCCRPTPILRAWSSCCRAWSSCRGHGWEQHRWSNRQGTAEGQRHLNQKIPLPTLRAYNSSTLPAPPGLQELGRSIALEWGGICDVTHGWICNVTRGGGGVRECDVMQLVTVTRVSDSCHDSVCVCDWQLRLATATCDLDSCYGCSSEGPAVTDVAQMTV